MPRRDKRLSKQGVTREGDVEISRGNGPEILRGSPLSGNCVNHGDELNYFFPILNKEFESLMLFNTESDNTMINIMTELWSHFMRTGVPSTWSIANWPAYRYHHEYMLFKGSQDINITIEKNYYLKDRMEFWDNLIYNYSDESIECKVWAESS
ncbi:hypothetical protein HZH68_011857 [Vespula germanica]|uniref:Carboxylesterase type B domain-containing protein n=1 Tax=Vespula germanica TaxID=30212 RepID=A0A834MYH9_VESGE|nr:hypothetical protein HZH68_011857 [Vespula germanica]